MVDAVELVADTVAAIEPRLMRKQLLSGLVHDLGMNAAALWSLAEDGKGLHLLEGVGLQADQVELFTTWPSGSAADKLARTGSRVADRIAISHADVEGLDGTLYLMVLPEPATELLGVIASSPIGEDFTRLLAALGRAYAAAIRQAALLHDNRRIVDSLVEDLRPSGVVLPAGYGVGHLYRSATEHVAIGGDLYDWFRTSRGQLGIAVGDVSGKGMQAASRSAMAVHSLRALAMPGAAPHVVAQMLNGIVAGQLETERFVTLLYLRIDPETGDAEFVLAGHPPPLLVRDGTVEVIDANADLPLGIDAVASFARYHLQLEPGDRVVMYTDGVTEARSAHNGALLELSGLVDLVSGAAAGDPQQLADAVWAGVQDYTGGATSDDCAVVVLGRDLPAGEPLSGRGPRGAR